MPLIHNKSVKLFECFQSIDGVEHLYIPIDEGTLKEFVEEHNEV